MKMNKKRQRKKWKKKKKKLKESETPPPGKIEQEAFCGLSNRGQALLCTSWDLNRQSLCPIVPFQPTTIRSLDRFSGIQQISTFFG